MPIFSTFFTMNQESPYELVYYLENKIHGDSSVATHER